MPRGRYYGTPSSGRKTITRSEYDITANFPVTGDVMARQSYPATATVVRRDYYSDGSVSDWFVDNPSNHITFYMGHRYEDQIEMQWVIGESWTDRKGVATATITFPDAVLATDGKYYPRHGFWYSLWAVCDELGVMSPYLYPQVYYTTGYQMMFEPDWSGVPDTLYRNVAYVIPLRVLHRWYDEPWQPAAGIPVRPTLFVDVCPPDYSASYCHHYYDSPTVTTDSEGRCVVTTTPIDAFGDMGAWDSSWYNELMLLYSWQFRWFGTGKVVGVNGWY